MRVDLNAEVRTRDGEVAGMVKRAIIAPQADEVSDFVITTSGLFGYDVLVPRERLETATRAGDTVHLDISRDELKAMPRYDPTSYIPPDPDWTPPAGLGYPSVGFLWPAGFVYPERAPASRGRGENEGELWPAVRKGSVVRDRAGHEIGVVDDVQLDAQSGHLEGMIIRAGGSIQTFFGGGETKQIASTEIERLDEGEVYLRVDKDAIERAPH
jgi:sporulation protein YlmC with PRC-barrel domain